MERVRATQRNLAAPARSIDREAQPFAGSGALDEGAGDAEDEAVGEYRPTRAVVAPIKRDASISAPFPAATSRRPGAIRSASRPRSVRCSLPRLAE